jgi:ribosomal-protein-alanine N-acetyltransferase
MTVSVRSMTLDDMPEVVRIDQMSFSLPWPENSYRYEVRDNKAARCFVAEASDKQVVAMIVSWMIVDELHIATLATDGEHRREGIGSRLLVEALRDARALGAKRVFLEVRESNFAAKAMYQKFGFETTSRRPNYYRDNGEDAILMTLASLETE